MSEAGDTEPSRRRGRRLSPLDPAAGPTQSFATRLRELRREAGDPSFAEMARRVHWGTTTLAAAARGDRLPTWSVTEGFVQALDGDVGVWRGRWESAHREVHGLATEPGVSPEPVPEPTETADATAEPALTEADADATALPPMTPAAGAEEEAAGRGAGSRPSRPRRRRMAGLALLVALVLAVTAVTAVVAVVAFGKDKVAARRHGLIASAEAARQADLIRSGDPRLALRLGLAAYGLAPSAEARGALWSSSAASYPLSLPGGLGAPVTSVAASPDGRIIAATARGAAVARLWSIPDQGRPTLASDLRTSVQAPVIFSPVGHLLAAAGPGRAVLLWDVSHPTRPVPLGHVLDRVGSVASMAFSPDGRTLAVTDSRNRTVQLLDLSDPARPTVEGTVSDGGRELSSVVISPDGHTIATADPTGEVKLWAIADRHHPRWTATLPRRGTTTSLAFSPTTPVLAVTGDGSCELWDTTDPARPTSTLRCPASGAPSDQDLPPAVAFGPDGRFLLRAGADGTVEMANAANGQRYARFTEDAPVRAAAFDPLRQSVVTGTDNGTIHLWRALTPATVANQPAGDQQGKFSATGRLMTGLGADGGLSLWEMTDGHQPEVAASVPSPARDGLFTPDGETLITVGSDDATVWSVVDPHHPARLSSIDDPAGRYPGSTTMIPGTSTLAMSTPDGSVAFWDLAQPRRPRRTAIVRVGPPGVPATFVAGPARPLLAVRLAGSPLTVRLVGVSDPGHPTILGTLTDRGVGEGGPSDVAISGDGRVLAATYWGDAVRLWDIADPSRPVAGPVLSPAATPGAIAFAPRGGLLAVGSADSAVHLWDVRDARHPVALIALPAGFAAEHLAFSPDGRLLAAGGQNGTTLLWSTTDPHRVAPVGRITFSNATALLPAVTSISFDPDGGELSVSLAGRVQFLVDLDTDWLYHEYCTLPESRISRVEWKRYLPGVRYQPPC